MLCLSLPSFTSFCFVLVFIQLAVQFDLKLLSMPLRLDYPVVITAYHYRSHTILWNVLYEFITDLQFSVMHVCELMEA